MFRREARLEEMLQAIAAEAAATGSLTGRPRFDPRVMAALAQVPRDGFVPEGLRDQAFENRPLPIGEGQTISQPYIVALMTDLLDPRPGDVMLEIGTGSGYQAAVLAALIERLYSIEVIPALAQRAREALERNGSRNVEVIVGDGSRGLPQHAPYDGIIVTAAAPFIPPQLKVQLKPGGKLVIPVGLPFSPQQLLVVEREESGFHTRSILGVIFVPLVGAELGHRGRG